MQTMIPATFDRRVFDITIRNMTDEDAVAHAAANLALFAGCFSIGGETEPPKATRPPAKAKAGAEISKDALMQMCLMHVRAHPASKSEDVATMVGQPGPAVKRALESLVDAKTLSCEGTRRGRRYSVMTHRKQEEPEAAE